MWHSVATYNKAGEGVEAKVKVKASGGVRTLDSCLRMFKAGAERIGTSVPLHANLSPVYLDTDNEYYRSSGLALVKESAPSALIASADTGSY